MLRDIILIAGALLIGMFAGVLIAPMDAGPGQVVAFWAFLSILYIWAFG